MRDYAKLSLEDICIGLKKDHIWKVYIVYDLTEELCSSRTHNDWFLSNKEFPDRQYRVIAYEMCV